MNRLEIVDGATLIAVPSIGDDPILVTGTTDSAVAAGYAMDAIAAQVEAHRRRPIVLSMGRDPWLDEPLTKEEAAACQPPFGRLYDLDTLEPVSLATTHGTAAALKAEAPERHSMWRRAYEASERDMRRNVAGADRPYLDTSGIRRLDQRAARKVSNARKARRGHR